MFGVGVDMVEISRIKRSVKNKRFLKLIFSESEISNFESKNFSVQTIAASFCAKEAFSKAVGTGFRGFSFKDVGLFHDKLGKPHILLGGRAKELFGEKIKSISVSLTHTKNYASAVVLCEMKSSEEEFEDARL